MITIIICENIVDFNVKHDLIHNHLKQFKNYTSLRYSGQFNRPNIWYYTGQPILPLPKITEHLNSLSVLGLTYTDINTEDLQIPNSFYGLKTSTINEFTNRHNEIVNAIGVNGLLACESVSGSLVPDIVLNDGTYFVPFRIGPIQISLDDITTIKNVTDSTYFGEQMFEYYKV